MTSPGLRNGWACTCMMRSTATWAKWPGMEGTEDNPVLVVVKDGQEVLLPVGGDLIRHIDLERGRIDVRTPEGLVELYRKG